MSIILNFNDTEKELSFKKMTPHLKLECEKLEFEYKKNVQKKMFELSDNFKNYVPTDIIKELAPYLEKLNTFAKTTKKKKGEEYSPEQIQLISQLMQILEPHLKPIAEKTYKYDFAIDLAKLLIDRREIEGEIELIKAISSENNSEFWQNQYLEELNKAFEFFRRY